MSRADGIAPEVRAQQILDDYAKGGSRLMHWLNVTNTRKLLDDHVQQWREAMDQPHLRRIPENEGWNVFNTDHYLSCGVEKQDENRRLKDDDDALRHVVLLSVRQHAYPYVAVLYQNAVFIHGLCNHLRLLEWGAEHVHSRVGPQRAYRTKRNVPSV